MSIPRIDEKLSLSWRYAVGYILIAAPVLWVARPWEWDLPRYVQAIGCIVLPAVALVLLYFPALFAAAVIKDFSGQKKMLSRLALALSIFAVTLCLTVFVLGAGLLSSLVTAVAAMGVNYLVIPPRKEANQSSQPMPLKRHG